MTLVDFAEKQRMKVKKDECGDGIICGKYGHIFEYGSGRLGVCIMSATGTAHRWKRAREAFIAAGMQITQNGDTEGCAVFDPADQKQVTAAVQHTKVRPRKQVSPECRKVMLANLDRARQVRLSEFSI